MYEMFTDIIGAVPYGYEPVVYVIVCIAFIWMLSIFFSIVWNFFDLFIGGGVK